MTPDEQKQADLDEIERKRRRKEALLLLLLLGFYSQTRRFAEQAIRHGFDPFDAVDKVILGRPALDLPGIAPKLANVMATIHQDATETAATQSGGVTVPEVRKYELAAGYRPFATGAAEEIRQNVRALIDDVLARSKAEDVSPTVDTIVQTMREVFDAKGYTPKNPAQARTQAITFVSKAWSAGAFAGWRQPGIWEAIKAFSFVSVRDEHGCPICEPRDGLTLDRDHPYWLTNSPPLHYNCLPGDSLVSSRSPIAAASKRWFDGNLVVVRTASNLVLSCTPNHPILTPGGWVAAASLNVGGDVICDARRQRETFRDDNGENVEARIEDVAESFIRSREVVAMPVPVTAEDFHGDGVGSEVAVVGADRRLWSSLYAASQQHFAQRRFRRGGSSVLPQFVGLGREAFLRERKNPPSRRFVRGGSQSHTICPRCLRHTNGLLLASVAHRDSIFSEGEDHRRSTDAHLPSNARYADSLSEESQGFSEIESRDDGTALSHNDARSNESPAYDLSTDSMLARELVASGPGSVFSDKIIDIEIKSFHGFVYNLETADHWYVAEGVVTHNCRCIVRPVLAGFKPTPMPEGLLPPGKDFGLRADLALGFRFNGTR